MINIKQRELIDIVKYPIITDKATRLLELNQYSFAIDNKATKVDIKAAIEYLFQVKVVSVNTFNPPQKKRRIGRAEEEPDGRTRISRTTEKDQKGTGDR